MATEQAYYALTAYDRLQNGKSALYTMTETALFHSRFFFIKTIY